MKKSYNQTRKLSEDAICHAHLYYFTIHLDFRVTLKGKKAVTLQHKRRARQVQMPSKKE